MYSTVSKQGQTTIPTQLREKYKIKTGDKLAWVSSGTAIRVIPLPKNLIASLRGSSKNEQLLKLLMEERRIERQID